MTTRTRSPKVFVAALLMMLCALAQSASAQTQAPAPETSPAPKTKITSHRHIEPNTLAPELYEEKLSMKFTLVDLPGATDPRSTWDASYQLYFISEAKFKKISEGVMRRQQEKEPGRTVFGWNPEPADFPGKILLAEGTISKKDISTPQQRIHVQDNVAFKEKIPAELRTKGAHLLTAYSVAERWLGQMADEAEAAGAQGDWDDERAPLAKRFAGLTAQDYSFGTNGFGVKAAASAFGARQFEDALGALEKITVGEERGVALVTLCRAVLQRPKSSSPKTF